MKAQPVDEQVPSNSYGPSFVPGRHKSVSAQKPHSSRAEHSAHSPSVVEQFTNGLTDIVFGVGVWGRGKRGC